MRKSAGNTVRRTLDLSDPLPFTDEQRARLAAVAAMPDDQIDYSDAPHLSEAVWMKAADRLPDNKKQITLRLDSDVVDFFKHSGRRYQTRINAVLRAYVDAHKKAPG